MEKKAPAEYVKNQLTKTYSELGKLRRLVDSTKPIPKWKLREAVDNVSVPFSKAFDEIFPSIPDHQTDEERNKLPD
jgi:hypothetical protein